MSPGFALFCARDHRDVVVRSWLRPLAGGESKNGETLSARAATLAGADPGAELVLTGRGFGPRLLDAETLAGERRKSRLRRTLARARLAPTSWYSRAADVPHRARPRYGEFTFVYRDRRDGEIARMRVLLPHALGPALTVFLREQAHLEPIALLEGHGEIELSIRLRCARSARRLRPPARNKSWTTAETYCRRQGPRPKRSPT